MWGRTVADTFCPQTAASETCYQARNVPVPHRRLCRVPQPRNPGQRRLVCTRTSKVYVHHLIPNTRLVIKRMPSFTSSVNVGDDCPVFDGLFEYCSISAGGSMGTLRISSGRRSLRLTRRLSSVYRGSGATVTRQVRHCHQLGRWSPPRQEGRSEWILLHQR